MTSQMRLQLCLCCMGQSIRSLLEATETLEVAWRGMVKMGGSLNKGRGRLFEKCFTKDGRGSP